MATKLSFRARALDATKPLPVYRYVLGAPLLPPLRRLCCAAEVMYLLHRLLGALGVCEAGLVARLKYFAFSVFIYRADTNCGVLCGMQV